MCPVLSSGVHQWAVKGRHRIWRSGTRTLEQRPQSNYLVVSDTVHQHGIAKMCHNHKNSLVIPEDLRGEVRYNRSLINKTAQTSSNWCACTLNITISRRSMVRKSRILCRAQRLNRGFHCLVTIHSGTKADRPTDGQKQAEISSQSVRDRASDQLEF